MISREVLIHLIHYLVTNYQRNETVTHLLSTMRIHILVSMNPDGYAIADNYSRGDCTGVRGRYVKTWTNCGVLNNYFLWIHEISLAVVSEVDCLIWGWGMISLIHRFIYQAWLSFLSGKNPEKLSPKYLLQIILKIFIDWCINDEWIKAENAERIGTLHMYFTCFPVTSWEQWQSVHICLSVVVLPSAAYLFLS